MKIEAGDDVSGDVWLTPNCRYFEWTTAFIGSGMLIGMNSACSMMGGAVLAWGVIGPVLVHCKTVRASRYPHLSDTNSCQ